MALPQFHSEDRVLGQLQSEWKKLLDPVVDGPTYKGIVLPSVSLASGDNTIPHKLNKTLSGWFIVRQRAPATIYDKQDSNPSKDKNLVLNSSASVVVDIFVF